MTIETTKPAAADDTAYGSEVAACSTGQRGVRAGGATVAARPAAVAVDLGSGTVQVWASLRGSLSAPSGDGSGASGSPIRRGRVIDPAGCTTLLSELVSQYSDPVPAGGVVVACRPVLATAADQRAIRSVLAGVFDPARLLFIDTVSAAAVGAGTAAGALLIADIGTQLTEVALLDRGAVAVARRVDIGVRDLGQRTTLDLLTDLIVSNVNQLCDHPAASSLISAAKARGMLLVGDGALDPELVMRLSAGLRIPVRCAAAPRTAALSGAGLAAMAALRHPAVA